MKKRENFASMEQSGREGVRGRGGSHHRGRGIRGFRLHGRCEEVELEPHGFGLDLAAAGAPWLPFSI